MQSNLLVNRFFELMAKPQTDVLAGAARNFVIYSGPENIQCLERHEFLNMVLQMRTALQKLGLKKADALLLATPSSLPLLAVIIAAWAEGASICIVPHQYDAKKTDSQNPFEHALQVVKPKFAIVDDSLKTWPSICHDERFISMNDLMKIWADCSPSDSIVTTENNDIAILQFTSGSTGLPKAAVITQSMLSANCDAIAKRIELNTNDCMVSWLPMYHDMGLSAVTLALWGGIDLVLLPTQVYARQPLSWLDAITTFKGTLSPAPASAYALLPRFASLMPRRNLNLSTWRYAWAGAEPVFDVHLKAFEMALSSYGLKANVLQPAYGMAETVVATTLNAPGKPCLRINQEAHAMHGAETIYICSNENDEKPISNDQHQITLVSNGTPILGLECAIFNDDLHALSEGTIGVVHVRGSSVLQHYLTEHGPIAACNSEGWYGTGDVGFMWRGEVFITGRAKDLITRGGQNISPHPIELEIESFLGLRPASVAVIAMLDLQHATERIVAVIAHKTPNEAELFKQIARHIASTMGLQIDELALLHNMPMPKTTSGKIQRNALRQWLSMRQCNNACTTA